MRLEHAANLPRPAPRTARSPTSPCTAASPPRPPSRTFRAASGCSASEYRKHGQTERKGGQKPILFSTYATDLVLPPRIPPMSATPPIQPLSLNVRPLASRTLAYVRHVGPYASDTPFLSACSAKFALEPGRAGCWPDNPNSSPRFTTTRKSPPPTSCASTSGRFPPAPADQPARTRGWKLRLRPFRTRPAAIPGGVALRVCGMVAAATPVQPL